MPHEKLLGLFSSAIYLWSDVAGLHDTRCDLGELLRTGSMNIADSFSFYFASVGFYLYSVVTDISMRVYATYQQLL